MRRFFPLGAIVLILTAGCGGLKGGRPAPVAAPPTPPPFNVTNPQIHVVGKQTVYRVWVDEAGGFGRHIRFERSVDGGATWSSPITLDHDKPDTSRSRDPDLVTDEKGHILVTWQTKHQTGEKEIRFTASEDFGATWRPQSVRINQAAGAFEPRIAWDKDRHVYVTWFDERLGAVRPGARKVKDLMVYFTRSSDLGRTWAEDIPLSTGVPDKTKRVLISAHPVIGADAQGRVYVLWQDTRTGQGELFFRRSEDFGASWGEELNVSRGGLSAGNHSLLADQAGHLLVVWNDRREGGEAIFLTRSEDGGKDWTPPTRVGQAAPAGVGAAFPNPAVTADGRLYLAWQDERNGRPDIYLAISTDRGKSWEEKETRLDRDDAGTAVSRLPRVAADGHGRVAVVWEDDRAGGEAIYLTASKDAGRTWSREVVVSPPGDRSHSARNAQVALDEATGALHVIWEAWEGSDPTETTKRLGYRRLPFPK